MEKDISTNKTNHLEDAIYEAAGVEKTSDDINQKKKMEPTVSPGRDGVHKVKQPTSCPAIG